MTEQLAAGLARQNKLLAKLAPADLDALVPHLQPMRLDLGTVVYEAGRSFEHAYFLTEGLFSVVSLMKDGSVIEVAAVGREGSVGTWVLLSQTSLPYRCFVQIAGQAFRIGIDTLVSIAAKRPELHRHLLHYHGSLMVQYMQNVACNGLHSVEHRCCRWLLLARDRQDSDTIGLTHEFLGQMLGVRRASVTEVLKPLREEGLIDYTRGQITVLDRVGLEKCACECYRVITDEFAWLQ